MEQCIPVWFYYDLICVNQGLKLVGNAVDTAVSTQLKQLHSGRVIEPKFYHELTVKEQVDAL